MPRLNRIRIANVAYDHKYIVDELYDTYGGANTLLNLANGSGKSVLVQMILQPILPCKSIHGRRIESYLTRGGPPTYLMLEWKLDNTVRPTYFLTGIVMGFSRPNESDDVAQVKYFTFVHQYTEGNELDISRIHLVSHHEGAGGKGVLYHSYEDARAFVQEQEQTHRDFHVFAKDKKKSYYVALQEHGIFPEEWELLARVNEKEGGVDELFSNCKTSDTLLDRWILDVVSGGLAAGRGELLEMFEALMASILEEEKSLQDKERIEGFLEELMPAHRQMEELCADLDRKEQIEGQFSGLYRYLEGKLEDFRQEQIIQEEALARICEEEHHIRGEELSKQYYDKQEDCELCESRLETLAVIRDDRERTYRQAERGYRAYQAAEHYGRMARARQSMDSIEEEIRILREGEAQEDLRNVEFTLAQKYEEQAEISARSKAESEELFQKAVSHLRELKAERKALQERARELSGRHAALRTQMEAFQREEQSLFQRLDLTLNRNLLGELDSAEVKTAAHGLGETVAALSRQEAALRQEILGAKKRGQELRGERSRCMGRQLELGIQMEQAQRRLLDWRSAADALEKRLAVYAPDFDLYDREGNISFLQRQRETWRSEETQMLRQKNRFQELLENCRRGSLHTAPAFGEELAAAGLQFITGETYLKQNNIDEERQRELLRGNPLLPYCFLVARGDLKRAQEAAARGPIERVCPVMAVDDVEKILAAEGNTVFSSDSVRLICRYNWESLGAASYGSYEERLSGQLDLEKERCDLLRERLIALEQDIKRVEAFPYTREDGPALERTAAGLEKERSALALRIQSLEEEEESQRVLEAEKEREAKCCADALRDAQTKEAEFSRYLEENRGYEENMKALDAVQREQEAAAQREAELERDYGATDSNSRDLEKKTLEHGRTRQEYERKRGALSAPEHGVLLPFEIPVLEDRRRVMSSELSQNEQELSRKKAAASKDCEEEKQRLTNFFSDVPETEYRCIIFDDEELERRRKTEKLRREEWSDAQQDYTRRESELKIARDRKKDAEKSLRDAGWEAPLPPREIKGNYTVRRAECRRSSEELDCQAREIQTRQEECIKRQNAILRFIDPAAHAPAQTPPEGGYEGMEISAAGRGYKDLTERTVRGRAGLVRRMADLERKFRGTAATIDNVLNAVRLDEEPLTFKTYYFLFEKLSGLLDKLKDYLDILCTMLERVESQKENVVRQAASQGKSLYRELGRINANATVHINKGRTPQSTLHIGIPESLDGQEEERMRNYVSQCIATARESLSKGELSKEKMRRYLEERFSDRQLLNTVIGKPSIPIKLYKVESIPQNSRLKAWENIVVENSGGELFVSCFILITALISYARKRKVAQQNADEGSKVFLIDNPFGKASSPHLLEAMLEVARKFDTQLICLSDLSQSSIRAQFDLIYQLSLRKAAYSNRAYLKTDEMRNNAALRIDGKLEHVSAYWEQMSML